MEDLIYEIRGKQVMLDSDLARLYQCKNGTKDLNKAVKRNIDRFPEEFMFQLTEKETENLRFQNGTSSSRFQIGTLNDGDGDLRFQIETANDRSRSQIVASSGDYGGRRYLPYAFTEQGVAMLASVLHTEKAVEVSIKIINTFVKLRRYVSENLIEQKYVNKMVLEDHERIGLLEETLDKFEEKKAATEIYFNGQIYDSYSKILEIFQEAKEKLVIIDSYADEKILNIIRKLDNKIKITIITRENMKFNGKELLSKEDIEKYNAQYGNLEIKYDDSFHDRYFILDEKQVYHCGASVNRIGYKTFSITRVQDSKVAQALIKSL